MNFKTIKGGGSGDAALFLFHEIWLVDFEFQAPPGQQPHVICMVAQELRSGRLIRMWRDELIALRQAPFDCGANSLFVAYYASAEFGCFLALSWPFPACILDLFAEHRRTTNGIPSPHADSLIGALAYWGLDHIDVSEKESMRQLIMNNQEWSAEQQSDILDYCQTDVTPLAALLQRIAPELDVPRALLRGSYMAAVAWMEWTGIPIDMPAYNRLRAGWENIRAQLVAEVDRSYGVYVGLTFKKDRFAAYLVRSGIAWPRLPSGSLRLDDDTFKTMARLHPVLEPLRQLRKTLAQMRLSELAVGSDGRNRCLLSPFRSITGRNQPSNAKFIFGSARWLRSLIKPPEGYGLAYIDFSSQEIAIAAGLSGDELMMRGYDEGDPYLAFAKSARRVPLEATKTSHKAERNQCKSAVLGINYGMGPDTLSISLGIAPVEARELIRLYWETYRAFWSWSKRGIDEAALTGRSQTVFGWQRLNCFEVSRSALMNFPMQANGAEMMRVAAIAAMKAGIEVCAPIHDAFLIQAPLDQLDERVEQMRDLMTKAGCAVTGGFPVRTDATIVRYPDRYGDGGEAMWDRIMALLPDEAEVA